MTHAPAIEVKSLRYSYTPDKKRKEDNSIAEVLQGLSFDVAEKKITGLLGPNGSGKSTTFKILSTQIVPASGFAKVFGHDVSQEQAKVRGFMGVTFQAPSLDPLLTVEENLATFATLYGLSRDEGAKRIHKLLKTFSLTDRGHSRVKELSGGLARRVELAKALLPDPKLLMLDEPTTGLDPKLRRDFWRELHVLRDQGITILVTTHLMDEAELCDDLVFITDGKFAGQGKPEALKAEFGFEIVELTFKTGLSSAEEGRVATTITSLLQTGERIRVEDHRAKIETKRAREMFNLVAENFEAVTQNLSWGRPTLSDVYFAKTGKSL